MSYRLATQGVYRSIQGEGALAGDPMVFIRFAGCSIGCPQCDTDYRADSRQSVDEIRRAVALAGHGVRWAWLTGGEPLDRDITPLASALKAAGFAVAVATSGTRLIPPGIFDWISVSPHRPGRPAQWSGHEVKLVPGLNGLDLSECDPGDYGSFPYRYLMPLHGDPASEAVCREHVDKWPGWRLGFQAHKSWGIA